MSILSTLQNAANKVGDFIKDNKSTAANIATGIASVVNPTLGTFVGALTGATQNVVGKNSNFQSFTGQQNFNQMATSQQPQTSKFKNWLNGINADGSKKKWYSTGWAIISYIVVGTIVTIVIIVKKPFKKGFKAKKW